MLVAPNSDDLSHCEPLSACNTSALERLMSQILIPKSQQGTSTWNFTVSHGGVRNKTLPQMMGLAKRIGFGYLDLVAPDDLATVANDGDGVRVSSTVMLDYDGAGTPPFQMGPNNPANHELFESNTIAMIDACAETGICDTVVVFFGDQRVDPVNDTTFTGDMISLEDGIANCVAGYQKVVGHAEAKKVNLSLELLCSKDRGHPMKGHPGYQGDRWAQVEEVIKQVGSPRLNLLLDVYHFSLMERSKKPDEWIRALAGQFNHYHDAGMTDRQECHCDSGFSHWKCAKALYETGWAGAVIHEYLPTVKSVEKGLRDAMAVYTGA